MLVRATTRARHVPRTLITLSCSQVRPERSYATDANRPATFKQKSKDTKFKKGFSRKNRISFFRTISPNQLPQPIFKSQQRSSLELPAFTPKFVTEDNVGKAAHFEQLENDPIKYFGTPRNILLEYRLLSQRASVIRDVTVGAARLLDEAEGKTSDKTRVVMTGRPGSGKSTLLIQAVRYALAKDWVVIYIPRARQTVNSSTAYSYDLRTQTYLQPQFAHQTLRRLLAVNKRILSELKMSSRLTLEKREIQAGTSLAELADLGVQDGIGTAAQGALAPVILDTFMTELGKRKTPVLLAIDDFQCLYTPQTLYRDPHFSRIRPYHLSVPRLFLEYASGKRSFGAGAILGAISHDPEWQIPVELRDALQLGPDMWDLCASSESGGGGAKSAIAGPWEKKNKTLQEYARGLENLELPKGFTLPEAATAFEVWRKDGGILGNPTDELFLSKYTESGGNPRDFIWNGLLFALEGVPPSLEEVSSAPWPHLREVTLS
ncbi:mitochondrial carrier protein [Moniliophthora roreri MCA 2997]|uniref:Small ribosomal subunit protein mS29 n=2 Tax=Moniliophthora roreri TaxID=221103 RepID=V2XXZ9_MONRO|nr:mitochondrial carrier protein [Moniliophthora roreri MCA 2997]